MERFPDRPFVGFGLPTINNIRKQELLRTGLSVALATFTLERSLVVSKIMIEANLPPLETALCLLVPEFMVAAGTIVARSALESFRRFISARDEMRYRHLILTGQLAEPTPKDPAQGLARGSAALQRLLPSSGPKRSE